MKPRLQKIFSGILIAVFISSLAITQAVFATPPQARNPYAPVTQHEPRRGINPETGKVSFIGAGEPVLIAGISDINNLPAPERAMEMAKVYGKEFGLKNPSQELKLLRSKKDENGKDIVHFQQMYQGVPILGGEMIVNMSTNGDLLSISGEVSSDLTLNTNPAVKAQEARKTALTEIARLNEVNETDLMSSEPELRIFDESLLTASTRPVELVWQMEVTARDPTQPIREMVLVNAQTDEISFHVNQVHTQSGDRKQVPFSAVESDLFQEPLAAWPLYFDMELDEVRGWIYGSDSTGNKIDVISMSTFALVKSFVLVNGANPKGIALSPDGSELAIAQNGASSILFLNPDTGGTIASVVPNTGSLNKPWDVIYGRTGRLYSSGNPGASGMDYIHVINTVTHTEIARSALGMRDAPLFAISPDGNWLYVNSIGSPTHLYKFDVSTDVINSYTKTAHLANFTGRDYILDPVNDLIFTNTGQVWTTDLKAKIGETDVLGQLTSIPNRDAVAIATSSNTIIFASAEDFYSLSTYELPVPATIGELVARADGSTLYANTSNGIVAVDLSAFPPGQPASYPEGSLPYFDLVLDEAHGVLYGSNTNGHRIDVISTSTLQVIDQIRLDNGSRPLGMDLNPATNELAVALGGASQLAFIDTDTNEIIATLIPVVADQNLPFDVKYGRAGRLYSTGSGQGNDYVHVIDTTTYTDIGRSLPPNAITDDPYLAITADRNFIYANEWWTDRIYKFDVSTDSPVLQTSTPFGANFAAKTYLLLEDNTKIFTSYGQVWSSDLTAQLGSSGLTGRLVEIPGMDLVAVLSEASAGLVSFVKSADYYTVSTLSVPSLSAVGESAVTSDSNKIFLNTNSGIKALNISMTDPTSTTVESGSLQSVQVSTPFQNPLKVKVRNLLGNPMPGVTVTFRAPTSGASITFADTNSNTTSAVTDADGIATSPLFTANHVAGKYTVQASIPTLEASAAFQLENLASVTCTIVNGSGSATLFRPYKQFRCGLTTYGMASGDFNTDGRKDVAISAAFGRLLVFLQDQNGNLSQPRVYAGGESGSAYVIAGDLNQDGRDDLAIPSMGAILLFYQKPDGTFPYPVKYTIDYAVAPMAIDDVNNDGLPDLVVAMTANLIGVLTQKEDGTLTSMVTYPSLGSAEIAVGDINSDGRNDLVSMNTQTTNQLQIYIQKSDHTLNPYISTGLTGCSSYCSGGGIAIGDVTGDGRADMVMSYGGNKPSSYIAVFAQDAAGNLLAPVSFSSYDIPDPVEIADVNSDDLPDIVTLHSGWSRAGVHLGQEDGTLGIESLYTIPYKSAYYPLELDISDINTDGLPDVLITDSQGLVILYRAPSYFPSTPTPSVTPVTPIPPTPSRTPQPTLTPITPSEGGYRSTYSLSGGTTLPGSLLCTQTKTSCTNGINLDADQAHQYAADTFNFYRVHHGRNSFNDLGATIISSVDYWIGYRNAFWNGSQMVYGDSMAADDVVGHELTHAVTQYTSDLIYSYQSGAINESFSDLWGEFIDQTNGSGNDQSSVTWLLAEDSALGPIRSMKNPPAYGDPDKMSSPYYYRGPDDNGGVHINSGVNNKAAYLMVEGGAFNGKTIAGIGLNKTAAVYYEVQTNLLTSGANYNDLYYALIQGCQNLIGGADGITQNDCDQVKTAAEAVEMATVFIPTPTSTGVYTPLTSTPTRTPIITPTLRTLWFNSTQSTYAEFGGSVNSAGDVNGDGFDDVLIGSSGYWDGQVGEGAALLYLGSATGPLDAPSWSVQSNQAGGGMGSSVDTAGDVNGDGFSDILVSVPGYSAGQSGEGAVFAYYGSPTGPATTPNWIAESNVASMGFGTSVSGAGDLNKDGYDDVVIGTRFCDNGQTDEGCVYIYMGSAAGLKPAPAWVIDSDIPNAGFGFNVDGAGDVNGDGYDDVLVTSYHYIFGQLNGGKAYVFRGGPNGLVQIPYWVGTSGIAMDGYGNAAAGAGDVNGDGYADILIGAPGDDVDDQIEGKAYLYFGSPSGPSLQPNWTAQDGDVTTTFGASVGAIGDYNHDGYDDIVVGDPIYYQSQSITGAVFVYFGSASKPSTKPSFSFSGGLNNSAFGSAVGPAGKVDNDVYADFLVGAPRWWNPGRALLIFGSQMNPMPTKTPTNTPVTPTATNTSTPTMTPTQSGVNVWIRGVQRGNHVIQNGQFLRVNYPAINNGPVKIINRNSFSILAAERVIYRVNGANTSFSEMMGLPASQLNTTYWLPWYNNVGLDTQLRFANVSNATASVHVYIGGEEMDGSPFTLLQGDSMKKSFPGVDDGPVKIESDQDIVAAARLIYKVQGVNTSFSEIMALPASQLDTTYWLPWYNNTGLDTQLRFANVTDQTASVHIYIGGEEMTGSPFTLLPGESTRKSFPSIDAGPVQIVSDQDIVAAERLIYKVNGIPTSFSEMMALPNEQLDTTYWLPWYNNLGLDTQLRFANTTNRTATVHIFIGDEELQGSPFTLQPGESTRKSFQGIDDGPVKIVSDVPIVVAERVIYKVNGIPTSFSEMMALPDSLLDSTFWFPWYNNVDLDTQLRFGVP
jgi:Zn-dependent metalloprotease/uncharacterized protein YcfL